MMTITCKFNGSTSTVMKQNIEFDIKTDWFSYFS